MVPDLLLLTAALTMLIFVPLMARHALAMSRVVVATDSGIVLFIALLWLGWVLLTWSELGW